MKYADALNTFLQYYRKPETSENRQSCILHVWYKNWCIIWLDDPMETKQNKKLIFFNKEYKPGKTRGIIAGMCTAIALLLLAAGISTTSRDLNAGLSE